MDLQHNLIRQIQRKNQVFTLVKQRIFTSCDCTINFSELKEGSCSALVKLFCPAKVFFFFFLLYHIILYYAILYSKTLVSTVSFTVVSLNHVLKKLNRKFQTYSKHLSFKLCTILSNVMKSHAVPPGTFIIPLSKVEKVEEEGRVQCNKYLRERERPHSHSFYYYNCCSVM